MKTFFAISVLITSIAFAACGSDGVAIDDEVGATCIDDRDCLERCEVGNDFPGGFCTVTCRDDADCPFDTICSGIRGNICLYDCAIDRDCDFLGRSYVCDPVPDFAGRSVNVCIGD